jgi:hypothetical protein
MFFTTSLQYVIHVTFLFVKDGRPLLKLIPKKGMPPVLPETRLLRALTALLHARLLAIARVHDDDEMVARSYKAELLARLVLDDDRIFIVLSRLYKAIMPGLFLLQLLLRELDLLFQLAIRPRLYQRSQQKGDTDQSGKPQDRLRK